VDRTALIGVPTSAGPRVPLPPADRLLLFGFDDPDDLGEAQQALLARHAPHFGQGLTLAGAMACLEVFLASSAAGRRSGGRTRPPRLRPGHLANDSFVVGRGG
jgi:hypothetical protein